MGKRQHTNPDGSVVTIFVGNDARIGARARIGDDARIGDFARIGDGDGALYPVCICKLPCASFPGWVVTMTEKNMQVGCQFHALDAWWAFTDDEIVRMDSHALVWWRENRPILEAIARARGWLREGV